MTEFPRETTGQTTVLNNLIIKEQWWMAKAASLFAFLLGHFFSYSPTSMLKVSTSFFSHFLFLSWCVWKNLFMVKNTYPITEKGYENNFCQWITYSLFQQIVQDNWLQFAWKWFNLISMIIKNNLYLNTHIHKP